MTISSTDSLDSLKSRYSALVSKRDELNIKKVELESRKKELESQLSQVLSKIQTQFHVNTIEEAQSLYESQLSQLDKTLTDLESKFDSIKF